MDQLKPCSGTCNSTDSLSQVNGTAAVTLKKSLTLTRLRRNSITNAMMMTKTLKMKRTKNHQKKLKKQTQRHRKRAVLKKVSLTKETNLRANELIWIIILKFRFKILYWTALIFINNNNFNWIICSFDYHKTGLQFFK